MTGFRRPTATVFVLVPRFWWLCTKCCLCLVRCLRWSWPDGGERPGRVLGELARGVAGWRVSVFPPGGLQQGRAAPGRLRQAGLVRSPLQKTDRPVGRQQVYHPICALRCRSVSPGFWLPKIRVLKDEATEIVVWFGECSVFRAEHQSRQFELAPMSCGRCLVQPDSVGSVPAVVPSAAPARGRPG